MRGFFALLLVALLGATSALSVLSPARTAVRPALASPRRRAGWARMVEEEEVMEEEVMEEEFMSEEEYLAEQAQEQAAPDQAAHTRVATRRSARTHIPVTPLCRCAVCRTHHDTRGHTALSARARAHTHIPVHSSVPLCCVRQMSDAAKRVKRGMTSASGVEFAPWMTVDADAIAKAKREREERKAREAAGYKVEGFKVDPQAAELSGVGGLSSKVHSHVSWAAPLSPPVFFLSSRACHLVYSRVRFRFVPSRLP